MILQGLLALLTFRYVYSTVVICAIVKNEELYIDEWVKYNRYLGFNQIFLYDNSPDFALKDFAKEYPNFVDVKHFPGPVKQLAAYNDCFDRQRNTVGHVWAAALDVDEFIVLKKNRNIRQYLHDLKPNGGSISINWVMFGSSGVVFDGKNYSVLSRFTHRNDQIDQHVKTIVYVPHVIDMSNPHHPTMKDNNTRTDSHGNILDGPFNLPGSNEIAIIHHYHKKTLAEYVKKRRRGRSDIANFNVQFEGEKGMKLIKEDFDLSEATDNNVEDTSALDFFNSANTREVKKNNNMKKHNSKKQASTGGFKFSFFGH